MSKYDEFDLDIQHLKEESSITAGVTDENWCYWSLNSCPTITCGCTSGCASNGCSGNTCSACRSYCGSSCR